MKRADVTDATDYLTTQGQHVRVLDTTPGWALLDGEWVEAKAKRRRYVKDQGWMEYQTNYAIRAELVDPEGWPIAKLVLHPRVLVREWKATDEIAAEKAAKVTDAHAKTVRRFRSAGLVGVKVSTDGKTTTATTASLAKALNLEEQP